MKRKKEWFLTLRKNGRVKNNFETFPAATKYKRPLRFVLQALKLLKEAGTDIDHTDKKGNSALSIVQKIGNAEAIQILSK